MLNTCKSHWTRHHKNDRSNDLDAYDETVHRGPNSASYKIHKEDVRDVNGYHDHLSCDVNLVRLVCSSAARK